MLRRCSASEFRRVSSQRRVAADLRRSEGIEQVVMNLTLNARDAMPRAAPSACHQATSISQLSQQTPPEAKPASMSAFRSAIRAPGWTKLTRARIFEPFFTTKEGKQRTGMGLATVSMHCTSARGMGRRDNCTWRRLHLLRLLPRDGQGSRARRESRGAASGAKGRTGKRAGTPFSLWRTIMPCAAL
jgi:hypothetical protein